MTTTKDEWIIVLALLCVVLMTTVTIIMFVNTGENPHRFEVPKVAGIYYSLEEPVAIAVFNLNDPDQLEIGKAVDIFFKNKYTQLNSQGG